MIVMWKRVVFRLPVRDCLEVFNSFYSFNILYQHQFIAAVVDIFDQNKKNGTLNRLDLVQVADLLENYLDISAHWSKAGNIYYSLDPLWEELTGLDNYLQRTYLKVSDMFLLKLNVDSVDIAINVLEECHENDTSSVRYLLRNDLLPEQDSFIGVSREEFLRSIRD